MQQAPLPTEPSCQPLSHSYGGLLVLPLLGCGYPSQPLAMTTYETGFAASPSSSWSACGSTVDCVLWCIEVGDFNLVQIIFHFSLLPVISVSWPQNQKHQAGLSAVSVSQDKVQRHPYALPLAPPPFLSFLLVV